MRKSIPEQIDNLIKSCITFSKDFIVAGKNIPPSLINLFIDHDNDSTLVRYSVNDISSFIDDEQCAEIGRLSRKMCARNEFWGFETLGAFVLGEAWQADMPKMPEGTPDGFYTPASQCADKIETLQVYYDGKEEQYMLVVPFVRLYGGVKFLDMQRRKVVSCVFGDLIPK
jgi:hypothetical protein